MTTKKYIKLVFEGMEGAFYAETQEQLDHEMRRIWEHHKDQMPQSRTVTAEEVEMDDAEYNALSATNVWWAS